MSARSGWIGKKNLLAPFGAIPGNFSMCRKNKNREQKIYLLPILLGGPMSPIQVWALAAIHPRWGDRYLLWNAEHSAQLWGTQLGSLKWLGMWVTIHNCYQQPHPVWIAARVQFFFPFFAILLIFTGHLWVRKGPEMIGSHRAPSSLNMSSYRTIWTHFRPNSMIFINLILQTSSCWHLG